MKKIALIFYFSFLIAGCGLTAQTYVLDMKGSVSSVVEHKNLNIVDTRVDKRIEVIGLSPGPTYFQPDPSLAEILERKMVKNISLGDGDFVKIQIINVTSSYHPAIIKASAGLSITIQAEGQINGRTFNRVYAGGETEDNFSLGLKGVDVEGKIQEYVLAAADQISMQINNDFK